MPVTVRSFDGLDEAQRAMGQRGARYLGGGTIVMRAVNAGDQSFDTIVRARDAALREVRPSGDRIAIGAGVTMAMILAHRDLAVLAPAARLVGGPAVRAMATVGGNLFAPHPYGDLAVALLALGATVQVVGETAGHGRDSGTDLAALLAAREREPRRIVRSVTIERPRDASAFRFRKVSRVRPKGVSVMSMAALLPVSGGRVRGARVAYGAMAATPVRVRAVERALEGQALDARGVEAALACATEGLEPPTDAIASAWYRREVAPVHLRRLLLGEG